MKWTTVSNGHKLTITMDTENLIKSLNSRIADFQKEIEDGSTEDNEYERCKVYGDPENDFFTPEECITDLDGMKDAITKLAADTEGATVWPMVVLKKNGTFKRSVKPTIQQEKFGPYWEDSYGWNVEILRIEPITDTEAEIILTDVVKHY